MQAADPALSKPFVRERILTGLASFCPGFKVRKKEEALIRKIAKGHQAIGLALADYRPEYVFSCPVSIRLDEVEEIFNRFSGSPPRYHHVTLTTVAQLGYFYGQTAQKEFRITTEAEIDAAVGELGPLMRDRVVPLLDRLLDVPTVDAFINSAEGDRFDRMGPPYRPMRAVLLAYLTSNPAFEAIATRSLAGAETWHPGDRKKLTDLLDHLRGERQ